jgi:acid stress chaperone HdeA
MRTAPSKGGRIAGEEHHPMKIRHTAVGVVAAVLMTGSALGFAEANTPRKPIRAMTCDDFLLVEDAAKPEIVYWVATYGKPQSAVIDVDDSDRIVPVVVEACRQSPSESFWQKVRAEARNRENRDRR